MNIRTARAVPVFLLSLSLAACSAGQKPAEPVGPTSTASTTDGPPEPKTAGDYLDRAEKAMASEAGWTYAVQGKEALTLQGKTPNTASYRATVQRTGQPVALHSQGLITSKGRTRPEEIFLLDGTVHVKEGTGGWQKGPVGDPEMANKVEDPVAATAAFRQYLRESAGEVTLAKADGTVRLEVRVSARRLPEVQDRALVKTAVRELDPTLAQLGKSGVPVDEKRLTVSEVSDQLVLDPATLRIKSHRLHIRILIPYGGRDIAYEQDVRENITGTFAGSVRLPAGV